MEGEGAAVETWRCPTCLAVVPEGTTDRCPGCRSKLRKRRGQPIILGDVSRLDLQAALPIDRLNRLRLERGPWKYEPPATAPVPAPVPTPSALELALAEPDTSPVHHFDDVEPPRRALRLMTSAASNRRRWIAEINRRRGDDLHTR